MEYDKLNVTELRGLKTKLMDEIKSRQREARHIEKAIKRHLKSQELLVK